MRRVSSCANIIQPPENPQSRRPRMWRARWPKFFAGGKIGGRSFGAMTQEGNYASARDPQGGLPTPARSVAPALDTSTAHPPVMPEPATTRGDTTWRSSATRTGQPVTGHSRARAEHHQGTAGPERAEPLRASYSAAMPSPARSARPAPASCVTTPLRAPKATLTGTPPMKGKTPILLPQMLP